MRWKYLAIKQQTKPSNPPNKMGNGTLGLPRCQLQIKSNHTKWIENTLSTAQPSYQHNKMKVDKIACQDIKLISADSKISSQQMKMWTNSITELWSNNNEWEIKCLFHRNTTLQHKISNGIFPIKMGKTLKYGLK